MNHPIPDQFVVSRFDTEKATEDRGAISIISGSVIPVIKFNDDSLEFGHK
jgi:hypothetical protein